LNRHPTIPPRVGLAWLDPMCGLMLAFIVAASLWRRRRDGCVARVDFSMIEAMLWTMADPLIGTQLGTPPTPMGNASPQYIPHGSWRCAGDDDWISIAVRNDGEWRSLCRVVATLADMEALDLSARIDAGGAIDRALSAWCADRPAQEAAEALIHAGIPAAALARSGDLVHSDHLRERGFWDPFGGGGVLPGLPWKASFGRITSPAPGLGADTDSVLHTVLGLSLSEIADLRAAGAFG
jgi:crotonobetainyl-CoA:carnitine CoA-transferase CaiB-like acyl-CoA transferase